MTKSKIKILIIGPFPDPISGVSLANKVVKEVLDESLNFRTGIINTSLNKFDEKLGKLSLIKLFSLISFNLKLYKVFKHNIIYITPGQTFFGVLKYTLFILLASILKKEIIIHVHGNHLGTEYKSLKGIKKKTFYYLLSKATKGIVLSESLKENMSPFIDEKDIYILYNFAQDYLVPNVKKEEGSDLKIIFLSNLMEDKGIVEFLEALKRLESENIGYAAKIAGNIDEMNEIKLMKYFDDLKFTKYIGVVAGKEKKELLEWSNIFILPTYYKMEGQPISIIEAMATSNVIITTKHAGIPDIIKEKVNGYFVEKKSTESIYNRFKYLIENRHEIEQIAKRNELYFQKHFTIKHFKKHFINILNS